MTTYKDAGVDPEKAGAILSSFAAFQRTRPRDPNVLTGIGPFASCYELRDALMGLSEPLLATSCDGVGTKSMLALEWGKLSGLGQDLVAMNVNDLVCVGARPLLFLDYYACGSLDSTQLTDILKSVQNGCELAGCSLVGGETAEMPGLYRDREFDLAGFAVGVVDKKAMLGKHRVEAGSYLIALEANGFHSNGFSLLRKLVESEGIRPEVRVPGSDQNWSDTLLAPTPIYVKALRPILREIQAAAHLTGGGLFENLVRVLPKGTKARVQSELWPIKAIYQWAARAARLETRELLSTFNCGVGMILIVPKAAKEGVIQRIDGIRAWEIGSVVSSDPHAEPVVEWV